jgi:hypothetical protein
LFVLILKGMTLSLRPKMKDKYRDKYPAGKRKTY